MVDREDALTEGLLRRGKVSEATQQIYRAKAEAMADRHALTQKSAKLDVDAALDIDLLDLFLAGEEYTEARLLFYASRWHWNLLNTDLPSSNAARLGCQSRSREQVQDPVTWEDTLLRVYQLVELSTDLGGPSCAAEWDSASSWPSTATDGAATWSTSFARRSDHRRRRSTRPRCG